MQQGWFVVVSPLKAESYSLHFSSQKRTAFNKSVGEGINVRESKGLFFPLPLPFPFDSQMNQQINDLERRSVLSLSWLSKCLHCKKHICGVQRQIVNVASYVVTCMSESLPQWLSIRNVLSFDQKSRFLMVYYNRQYRNFKFCFSCKIH